MFRLRLPAHVFVCPLPDFHFAGMNLFCYGQSVRMIMKLLRLFVPIVILFGVASTARAEELKCGNFNLAGDKLLRLQWQGMPLIVKDALDYGAGFEQAEQATVSQKNGKQVLNVTQSRAEPVSYRKEVALGPDGVELTVKYKLPAYHNDPAKPSIRYSFCIPMETLRDARWKACAGRANSIKVVQGKVGSSLSGMRYIAFRSDRVRLVFDFNPQGVTAGGDYCSYGEPVGCWSMEREGEFLVFSFGYRAAFYGGVFMSKCLIYEGDYEYDSRHPWRRWGYRGETPPMKLFTFGTAKPPKEATAADVGLYSKQRGYGWQRADGLRLLQNSPTGLINNCLMADGSNAGNFLVDIKPGRWLVTVRVAPGQRSVGPMELWLNRHRATENLTVKAGEAHSITVPVDHRGTEPLEVSFRGAKGWAVSSIALQPLLYQSEDFVFDRGLWNVDGVFTPR